MKKYTKHLKFIISLIIVMLVLSFFIKSFFDNSKTISEMNLSFNPFYIFLSILFLILFNLVTTICWQKLINNEHDGDLLKFREGVGIYNATGLAKYLPGKVWSYTFQLYFLKTKGFIISKVIFDNVLLLILSIATVAMISLIYFVLVFINVMLYLKIIILALSFIVYVFFLLFLQKIIDFLFKIASKIMKKNYISYKINKKIIFEIQIILIIAYSFYIGSLIFLCLGLNIYGSFLQYFEIGVISLSSATLGFLFLLSPGGLGVQESAAYFLLENRFDISLALVIPVVFRLVILMSDAIMGIISFFCVKNEIRFFKKNKKTEETTE